MQLAVRFPAGRLRLEQGQVIAAPDSGSTLLAVMEGAVAIELPFLRPDGFVAEVVSRESGLVACDRYGAESHTVQMRALVGTRLLTLDPARVLALLERDPQAASTVARVACARVEEVQHRLVALNEPSARRRLLSALLYLDRHLGTSCELAAGRILSVRQSELAAVAAVSRQTANRELRLLQGRGLIRVERAMVCLLDLPGIQALARGERLPYVDDPCTTCKRLRPDLPLACGARRRRRAPRAAGG